jgi:leucyl-tRNA synthetase
MICVNELTLLNCNSKKILSPLLVLISPFAPHISEELWSLMGKKESISKEKFPLCDNSFLIENIKNYPISFNGKMKFKKEFSLDLSTNEIESKILEDERTVKFLKGENPKKIIIVKGKIINIVI